MREDIAPPVRDSSAVCLPISSMGRLVGIDGWCSVFSLLPAAVDMSAGGRWDCRVRGRLPASFSSGCTSFLGRRGGGARRRDRCGVDCGFQVRPRQLSEASCERWARGPYPVPCCFSDFPLVPYALVTRSSLFLDPAVSYVSLGVMGSLTVVVFSLLVFSKRTYCVQPSMGGESTFGFEHASPLTLVSLAPPPGACFSATSVPGPVGSGDSRWVGR